MTIYTFSTKQKRPEDTLLVAEVKKYCEQKHLNFSGLVIQLLKEWQEKQNGHK